MARRRSWQLRVPEIRTRRTTNRENTQRYNTVRDPHFFTNFSTRQLFPFFFFQRLSLSFSLSLPVRVVKRHHQRQTTRIVADDCKVTVVATRVATTRVIVMATMVCTAKRLN